ncbi:MAG: hypothetical protein RMK57_05110 [Bryobacterales bacterium]|nr:hypothetical protein [Bryobacteraceae bacterium]MDW8353893.1 hypothetical protein [Bryobacterales bacterium]
MAVRTRSGRYFVTAEFEQWKPVDQLTEPDLDPRPLRFSPGDASRVYALVGDVYRSDDGGLHWTNMTRHRRRSLLGAPVRDLAVSPEDPDHIVAVNDCGVWRSVDGGFSWAGVNSMLPNLAARRLLSLPEGMRGVRVLLDLVGVVEWAPGERDAWRPTEDPPEYAAERSAHRAARASLGAPISVVALGDQHLYAGASDGRIWVSLDHGATWRLVREEQSAIAVLFTVASTSRIAAAALERSDGGPRVLLTLDGGLSWEDLTGQLPAGRVNGLSVDRDGGAVYVATDRGVFLTFTGVWGGLAGSDWIPLSTNLPSARALDVRLDEADNQVYILLEGYGVFAAPAPHRFRQVRVVSVADYRERPAAPGALLSVLGARLLRARAGLLTAPVLHASELESHIQIPFSISGTAAVLDLEGATQRITLQVPLEPVAPAIFVDPSGTPLLLDSATGALLDAANPARSGTRVQILAAGLGRVIPDWEAGVAAPVDAPPRVAARIRAYVDRQPVEVVRAVLAPGYMGFYLVEVQLPLLAVYGPAELYLEADGRESNRVRIYLEP